MNPSNELWQWVFLHSCQLIHDVYLMSYTVMKMDGVSSCRVQQWNDRRPNNNIVWTLTRFLCHLSCWTLFSALLLQFIIISTCFFFCFYILLFSCCLVVSCIFRGRRVFVLNHIISNVVMWRSSEQILLEFEKLLSRVPIYWYALLTDTLLRFFNH